MVGIMHRGIDIDDQVVDDFTARAAGDDGHGGPPSYEQAMAEEAGGEEGAGRGSSGLVGAVCSFQSEERLGGVRGFDQQVCRVTVSFDEGGYGIEYLRFDYVNGFHRQYGSLPFPSTSFPILDSLELGGRYITRVDVWQDTGRRDIMRGIFFHLSDGTSARFTGTGTGELHRNAKSCTELISLAAGGGCSGCAMVTWLRFKPSRYRHGKLDFQCVVGVESSPIGAFKADHALVGRRTMQVAQSGCFIPRPSRWAPGTVSLELAQHPGHFLCYSEPALDRVLPPSAKQKGDDNRGGGSERLTIELLEPRENEANAARTEQPSFELNQRSLLRACFRIDYAQEGQDGAALLLASAEEGGGDGGRTPSMKGKAKAAEEIARTLRSWREGGVLLMDEVDLLLHPLKSELNFPIGGKIPIDLDVDSQGASGIQSSAQGLPKGLRWELPMAMLECVLQAEVICNQSFSESAAAHGQARPADKPSEFVRALVEWLEKGKRAKELQFIPHLVLLGEHGVGVNVELGQLAAAFALNWIERLQLLRWKSAELNGAVDHVVLLQYINTPEGQTWHAKEMFDAALAPATLQLLLLARQWISCFLVHSLKKLNRVNYGLLRGEQLQKEAGSFFSPNKNQLDGVASDTPPQEVPASRLLLALPFVGLEQPSESAEFAHPDVAIGLTILAFRYEGLREEDMRRLIEALKMGFKRGGGKVERRQEYQLWERWTNEATALAKQRGEWSPADGIYPLDTFQPDNKRSFDACYRLWKKFRPCVDHYLRRHVFPKVMECQELKISSSGQELGSSLLFRSRLAFSGTPSDLLPREESKEKQLFPCKFEPGSEAKVLATLCDKQKMTAWRTPDSWSVKGVLQSIATAESPRIDVLIDTGALVTGLRNIEVAQFLLDSGLGWAKGVVFLDDSDDKMVLLRSGAEGEMGRVVRLDQCGLAWEHRFSFYDQIHTTGMDIKQHRQAVAVVTVGKDTTLRDFAQGCYRMRGLAKGQPQRLMLLLNPEVLGLVRKQIVKGAPKQAKQGGGKGGSLLRLEQKAVAEVLAWLLLNLIQLENKQMLQLAVQNVDSVTRRGALQALLHQSDSSSQAAAPLLRLTDAFMEPVTVILPVEVPVPRTFSEELAIRRDRNALVLQPSGAGAACIEEMVQLVERQSGKKAPQEQSEEWGARDLDAAQTRTQEREQELEQEKQKQREVEREAEPWNATGRDLDEPLLWALESAGVNCEAFYPLSGFRLRALPNGEQEEEDAEGIDKNAGGVGFLTVPNGMGPGDLMPYWTPTGELIQVAIPNNVWPGMSFQFPLAGASGIADLDNYESTKQQRKRLLRKIQASSVLLSNNFAGKTFTSPNARRLRSLYIVLNGLDDDNIGYTVALSLMEAASVRRALAESLDSRKTASRMYLSHADGHTLAQGVKAAPSGATSPELQLLRFFDCQIDFSAEQGTALLALLGGVHPAMRKRFFSLCIMSRRRDERKWQGTRLAPLLQLTSLEDLMKVRRLQENINHALQNRGWTAEDMAREMDQDRNQILSFEEILQYLASKEMQKMGMMSRSELASIEKSFLVVADRKMDGKISVSEFVDFLSDEHSV